MVGPGEVVKTRKNHMDEKDATLTVDEAHALIGKKKISRGGLYAAINRKEVPHLRLGHRILIPRHAFMVWLGSSEQPSDGKRLAGE
jgi:excisionase family DNA binding protein